MASKIEICSVESQIDRNAWDEYIQAKDGSLYSEKIAWRDVLVESFALQDHLYVAKVEGKVVGTLELYVNKRLFGGHHAVTCPLSSSGGGLQGDTNGIIEKLVGTVRKLTQDQNLDYTLMRLMSPLHHNENWQLFDRYVTFVMDLKGGTEEVWANVIRGKTRNQLRKAEKYGFRVQSGHDCLTPFLKVLNKGIKELGSPCPGRKLFEKAIEHFGDDVDFIVITDGRIPVAGTILFYFGKTVSNPWAVSLKAYHPQCLNTLLYWEIIKSACMRSMQKFDLGRSLIGSGTYDFKRRLGAQETPLYYYYYLNRTQKMPIIGEESSKLRLVSSAWRHMPDFLTCRLGHRLIRELI
jgi:FemAB-related protein (PEP-CTERM system-associated)